MPEVSMYKCGRKNDHPYKLFTVTATHGSYVAHNISKVLRCNISGFKRLGTSPK